MPILRIEPSGIPEVVVIVPQRFGDARGFFVETYSLRSFATAGITASFVQDNQAFSARKGTLRGLHFQRPPAAQAKLVRVVKGRIFDVAVDLRLGSPTYRRWAGTVLTAECGEQMFVPVGFAHGYCTLEPDTEVAYKADGFYAPEHDDGIAWNDPSIGIAWPFPPEQVILSNKDRQLGHLADLVSPFQHYPASHV